MISKYLKAIATEVCNYLLLITYHLFEYLI